MDGPKTSSQPSLICQFDDMNCCNNNRGSDKRTRRQKTSFTEALKEKYCVEDDLTFDFIIVSPKRKTNNNSSAELAHLQTVVLNDMGITRADIPRQGLVSLCPNVVDLDLANNLLETWSELLSILSHLPKVRYLNVSRNRLNLDLTNTGESFLNRKLSVENLALNDTGTTIEEVVKLSQLMPTLKELHLCDNNYEDLANIEDLINDGAFSCLECLRLNNNEIARWSEVWKLRHLPHLKCLVLSGNPISAVFYHNVDRADNNSTEGINLNTRAGPLAATAMSQTTSESTQPDADINVKCLHCELADSNLTLNCECDGIMIDNFDQEDDTVLPINRFRYHVDSITPARKSIDQTNISGSTCDNFILQNPDNSFGMLKNINSGTASSNLNNSCQGNVQKCLCEGYDGFDMGYLLNDEVFENSNLNDGTNIEAEEEWHRAVAEEFLHEIIDGINFDDISDQRVPQFQPINFDETHIASYSIDDVEVNSDPDSIPEGGGTCSIDISTTEQLPVERTPLEVSVFGSNHAVPAEDSHFHLDYSPMSSDIDAQFIPRAIRLLDDDIKSSFFYMATPSPPRSRVQRCLFQEPDCHVISRRDEIDDSSYSRQSVSDSCSDCEAEQHKLEKEAAVEGANAGNNGVCTTPRTSPLLSKPEGSTICHSILSNSAEPKCSDSFPTAENSSQPIRKCVHLKRSISNCRLCADKQNLGSNNNNNVSEHSGYNHHCDYSCHHIENEPRPVPFQHLQVLCLSSANLHHWNHLTAFTAFPKLTNLRLKNNPLYSTVNPDDRRKLYIASLPKVSVLNGSDVTHTEREKAEIHYLRYFMDKEEKPDVYHTLVKKHGPPVRLVDIDLSAGYQEWANLKFVCKGVEEFSRKIHLVEPVEKLRTIISQIMRLPRRCFIMYHHSCGPSHPESERELVELRCESLPMSRFDFADGDEIHIDFQD